MAEAGTDVVEVRNGRPTRRHPRPLIPGGESTTMLKLLRIEKLFEELQSFGSIKPIFGACSGAMVFHPELTRDIRVQRMFLAKLS